MSRRSDLLAWIGLVSVFVALLLAGCGEPTATPASPLEAEDCLPWLEPTEGATIQCFSYEGVEDPGEVVLRIPEALGRDDVELELVAEPQCRVKSIGDHDPVNTGCNAWWRDRLSEQVVTVVFYASYSDEVLEANDRGEALPAYSARAVVSVGTCGATEFGDMCRTNGAD